ncbi:DegV domain-containing protein [subsurface metagenome]
MTQQVKIVTDSTIYLPPEVIARYDIRVVPIKVAFGTDVYSEGVDITNEEFYQRLAKSGTLPITSQPPVSDFIKVYTELAQEGHPILSIHISSKISGTINSVTAARKSLPQAQIEIVDSQSITMGMMVTPAAEAAEKGQTLAQVKASIEKLNACINVVGILDSLDYLLKGGRIGRVKALVGTLLKIKPVLTFEGGEAKLLTKARTMTRAIEYVLKFVEKRTEGSTSLRGSIRHAHVLEAALALERELRTRFNWAELDFLELGPVYGTHLGPGTIGLGFYGDKDWQPDQ